MAKLITLNDLTRFVTNIKNLIKNERTSIQADYNTKLSKKLDLIEPTAVQTEFVTITKGFDGSVQQESLTGVFTPQKQYPTYLPVLRGLQGQLKGQTAPLANQTDLDLINRAELTEKLGDIGGGLKWVNYSSSIPLESIYGAIVAFTRTGEVWRVAIAPVLIDNTDIAIAQYYFKRTAGTTGAEGGFHFVASNNGISNEVSIDWQEIITGYEYTFTKGYIQKLLIKE